MAAPPAYGDVTKYPDGSYPATNPAYPPPQQPYPPTAQQPHPPPVQQPYPPPTTAYQYTPSVPGAAQQPYPPPAQQPYVGYNQPPVGYNQPPVGYNQPPTYPEPGYKDTDTLHEDIEAGIGGIMSFNEKSIRLAFIRKVYAILALQMACTIGMTCWFMFHEPTRDYVQTTFPLYIAAYVLFLVLYFVLICCKSVARKHPTNLILLGVFTLSLSYMVAAISTYHNTTIVLVLFAVTLVSTFTGNHYQVREITYYKNVFESALTDVLECWRYFKRGSRSEMRT